MPVAKVRPIDENRRRLLGEADGGQLSSRLGDLVEPARLNGPASASARLARAVLELSSRYSYAKEAKENLMTCADVAKIRGGQRQQRQHLRQRLRGEPP